MRKPKKPVFATDDGTLGVCKMDVLVFSHSCQKILIDYIFSGSEINTIEGNSSVSASFGSFRRVSAIFLFIFSCTILPRLTSRTHNPGVHCGPRDGSYSFVTSVRDTWERILPLLSKLRLGIHSCLLVQSRENQGFLEILKFSPINNDQLEGGSPFRLLKLHWLCPFGRRVNGR